MASPRKKGPGLFVSFEGGEGAGKSTQIRRLAARLRREGYPVVVTREPGGSALGRRLRRALLDPRQGPVSPRAELLLYEADRALHVDGLIRPALAAGNIVLTDRYVDSSTIYQGLCRGLGVEWVERLNAFATGGLLPKLSVLLDVPVAVGRARLGKRKSGKDRIEREARAFHELVRRGFMSLARRERRRFAVIDGTLPPADAAREVQELVLRKVRGRR